MSDIGDYLKRKSVELGLERGGQLAAIQAHLETLYPGQCRAVSLNDGVLKITTPSASLASELRLQQVELRHQLTNNAVTRLIITVAGGV